MCALAALSALSSVIDVHYYDFLYIDINILISNYF